MVFVAHTNEIMNYKQLFFNAGTLGVVLFFSISGYVVSSALAHFYQNRTTQFLSNRGLKIFPIFWFCYVLSTVYLLAGPTTLQGLTPNISVDGLTLKGAFLAATIVGSIMDPAAFRPLTPAWTLAVELNFYVVAALFVVIAKNWRGRHQWLLGGLGATLAYGLILVVPNGENRFFGALQFTPFFALGVCVYFGQLPQYRLAARTWGGLAMIASLYQIWRLGADTPQAINLATALFFTVMVGVFLWCITLELKPKAIKVDKLLGDLTYPFYLCHVPVLAVLMNGWTQTGILIWVMTLVVCLLAAAAIHQIVEGPLVRIRTKVRGSGLG